MELTGWWIRCSLEGDGELEYRALEVDHILEDNKTLG